MKNPPADPILAELRARREAYAAKFNYDPEAIVKDIQVMKSTSDRKYITLPPLPATPPSHCHACGRPKDAT